MAKPLPPGVYAPLPAFFNDKDELGKHAPGFKLEMFTNIHLDLKAYVKHAICNKTLFSLPPCMDKLRASFANLARTDVAKPGVIPVVSATMGEAAHLVCTNSCSLGALKLPNDNYRIAKSAYN